jgi:hypothetical protein
MVYCFLHDDNNKPANNVNKICSDDEFTRYLHSAFSGSIISWLVDELAKAAAKD